MGSTEGRGENQRANHLIRNKRPSHVIGVTAFNAVRVSDVVADGKPLRCMFDYLWEFIYGSPWDGVG